MIERIASQRERERILCYHHITRILSSLKKTISTKSRHKSWFNPMCKLAVGYRNCCHNNSCAQTDMLREQFRTSFAEGFGLSLRGWGILLFRSLFLQGMSVYSLALLINQVFYLKYLQSFPTYGKATTDLVRVSVTMLNIFFRTGTIKRAGWYSSTGRGTSFLEACTSIS